MTDPNLSYTWCLPNQLVTLAVTPITTELCYANATDYFLPATPVGNPSVCDDVGTI